MKSSAITALPADADAVIAHLRKIICAGDVVLIKGSRGLHLERVVTALEVPE